MKLPIHILNTFAVICLCLVGLTSKAQDRTEYLTLTTGEVVECYVLKIENDEVHILREGTVEEILPLNSVVTFSEVYPNPISTEPSFVSLKEKRFYSTANIGFLVGQSLNNRNTGFSITYANTYQISPKLGTGLGIGFEWLAGDLYMPLYASFRYSPIKKKSAPFLMLNTGYSFINSRDAIVNNYTSKTRKYGGFMAEGFIGFQSLDNTERTGLEIGFGYRLQYFRSKETFEYNNDDFGSWTLVYPSGTVLETFQQLNRVTFRIGLTF